MSKPVHANGHANGCVKARANGHASSWPDGRGRCRQAAQTVKHRRGSAMWVAVALLVAACCMRLAAEAWHRGGGDGTLPSLAALRRVGRLGLESAMHYSAASPPAPVESVLTPAIVYGMLRLQYGRDSASMVDLRARSALEFPGVDPMHTTNASAFEQLLVASVQPDLQEELCVFNTLEMDHLTSSHAPPPGLQGRIQPGQGTAAAGASQAVAVGGVAAAAANIATAAGQPQQLAAALQAQQQQQAALAQQLAGVQRQRQAALARLAQNPALQDPEQQAVQAQKVQQTYDDLAEQVSGYPQQQGVSEQQPQLQQPQPQMQTQTQTQTQAQTQQKVVLQRPEQQPQQETILQRPRQQPSQLQQQQGGLSQRPQQQQLQAAAALHAKQVAAVAQAKLSKASVQQNALQAQLQQAGIMRAGPRNPWGDFEEDEHHELPAAEAVQAAKSAEAAAEASGGGASAAGVLGDNAWAGGGSVEADSDGNGSGSGSGIGNAKAVAANETTADAATAGAAVAADAATADATGSQAGAAAADAGAAPDAANAAAGADADGAAGADAGVASSADQQRTSDSALRSPSADEDRAAAAAAVEAAAPADTGLLPASAGQADSDAPAVVALRHRARRRRSLLQTYEQYREERARLACRMRTTRARQQDEADQLAEPLPPPPQPAAMALAGSRLCRLFAEQPRLRQQRRLRPHPSIALVGNAPLNETERPAIAAADFIVRFNWMHHRLPGERVHLWVLTHHPGSPERWGGFDDLDAEELAEVLGQQPTLLFLGGPPEDVQFALDRHSTVISRYTRVLHAPTEAYMQAFVAAFRRVKAVKDEREPTSGFTVAMLAVACTPPGTQLHAYGYNWSPRQADRHPMWTEHAVMKAMQAKGWMALHFSPCSALRSCGRIDERWCRARNDTCDFPKFMQADMLGAMQQRLDVRRLVGLMYSAGSGGRFGGKRDGSSGSVGSVGSVRGQTDGTTAARSSNGGGSHGSNGGGSHGSNGGSDGPGGHPAAEWRAVTTRPEPEAPQAGQVERAAAAMTASLIEAEPHPFCAALSGSHVMRPAPNTVALVGNGPLSINDRAAIASADRVVRMNQMNNWYPDERLDVWVARHAGRLPAEFYGFEVKMAVVSRGEVQPAMEAAENIVLWGGNTTAVEALLRHYPDLPADKLLHVDGDSFMMHYDRLYREAVKVPSTFKEPVAVSPTTGFVVALALLACLPNEAQLHVYGFNWSPLHWRGHDAGAEAQAMAGFAAAGAVHLHPSPCDGLRFCVRHIDPNCKVTRPSCWTAPTAYLRDAVYALQGELRKRGLAPARKDREDGKAEAFAKAEVSQYPDSLPHLCRRLRVVNASSIAIVGSTQLSAAERQAIAAADTVIRFDGVDGRLVSERQDMVWVVTFHPGPAPNPKYPHILGAGSYEGLDASPPADMPGAIASTASLVFWGGNHPHIKAAMDKHGLVLERKPEVARIVTDQLAPAIRLLRRTLQPPKPGDVPKKKMHTTSAHFGVLLAALGCAPGGRVQLLGFAGPEQAALMTRAEHAIVAQLVQHKLVQILDPAQ